MTRENGKAYPPVVVVDENDNEIGSEMLADVWRKGLYHRVVLVFILDEQGRMLLQLRSPNVKIFPNCWDQAAGGHVDEGYSYDDTAAKEIAEELGLRDIQLETLGIGRANTKLDDGRVLNRFERIYRGQIPADSALQPDPEEVSKLQWFTPAELRRQIAEHPEIFVPTILEDLRRYFPEFIS